MNNNKNNNNLLAFTTAMWPDITPSRCMFYISFFFYYYFPNCSTGNTYNFEQFFRKYIIRVNWKTKAKLYFFFFFQGRKKIARAHVVCSCACWIKIWKVVLVQNIILCTLLKKSLGLEQRFPWENGLWCWIARFVIIFIADNEY